MLAGKRVLLIIGGGIAAYKALDLIRRLRERGAQVRAVMTAEMGHIQLSRAADLVVVAPATANLMARMAAGMAMIWPRRCCWRPTSRC
jgi:phosphopantothenoylcysteine decarboxylase/phosphopantothenate--cysteine ligase